MKSIQSLFLIATAALLLTACEKNDIVTQMPVTYTGGTTNLKIVHASAYTTNYTVQLKVNDVRVSNNITYSTPFPGGGLNTGGSNMPWYMSLTPGLQKITMSVPKVGTNADSIMLYNGSLTLTADYYYTVFLADTAANTLMLMFTENKTMPALGTSRFKFLNLVPNLPLADLYYGTNKVASAIPYGSGGAEFIQNKNDTTHWYLRAAGALPTSAAIAVYPAASAAPMTVPNQRVFTVYSRGYVGGTGNKAPAISLTYN
jgi:hypothetical protein